MKEVGSLKIVTFKTDVKTIYSSRLCTNINLEMKSYPLIKEEKVMPLAKEERYPHIKSQNTCGLSKKKNIL